MSRTLVIRAKAEADLDEAFRWYQAQREGLGEDFLLCVDDVLERVRRTPELYPLVHRELRRAAVRRFPYGVFYVEREDAIVVVAVVHSARHPKTWQSRLET